MAKMTLKTNTKPVITGPVLTVTDEFEGFAEGDKLTSDKVQVEYATLYANKQGGERGDAVELPADKVLNIVHAVVGDNDASWQKRSDELWNEHHKAHPLPDISASVPQTVKEMALHITEDVAENLHSILEAKRRTNYGPLLLMRALEEAFEDVIDMWPRPDNDTEDGKPKEDKSYKWNGGTPPKYDRGYRPKPKGEKSVPSYYADLFDSMPDVGNIKLGESLAHEITQLEKVVAGNKLLENRLKEKRKDRTDYITAFKKSMKLRFKLQAIGEIMSKTVEDKDGTKHIVPAKAGGLTKVGYQIRLNPKTGDIERTTYPFVISEIGNAMAVTYKSVGQVLSLKPDDLPDDCSLADLEKTSGQDDSEQPTVEEANVYKDVATAEAAFMLFNASAADSHWWQLFQRSVKAQNKKTGEYINVSLVESTLAVIDNLESLRPALEEVIRANDKRKADMKAKQERKEQEALAKGHTTAA